MKFLVFQTSFELQQTTISFISSYQFAFHSYTCFSQFPKTLGQTSGNDILGFPFLVSRNFDNFKEYILMLRVYRKSQVQLATTFCSKVSLQIDEKHTLLPFPRARVFRRPSDVEKYAKKRQKLSLEKDKNTFFRFLMSFSTIPKDTLGEIINKNRPNGAKRMTDYQNNSRNER